MNYSLLNRIVSHLINYIYLAYVLLWFPLTGTKLINIDGSGYLGLLIAVVSLGINLRNSFFRRLFFLDKSILIWGGWALYVSFIWLSIGINNTLLPSFTFLWYFIFMPFYSMIVSSYEIMHNTNRTTLLILCFLFFYQIIGTYTELTQGSMDDEQRTYIVGNQLSLSSCALVFVACFRNINKWLNTSLLIGVFIFSAVSVFVIATRKAFVGLFIIIFFWTLTKYKLLTLKRIPFLFLFFYFIYVAISYVLDNTFIGQRFLKLEEENRFNTTGHEWLNIIGDRVYYYIEGWRLFLEHPIFGIGLRNFKTIVSGDYVIHSEYMVQLCECGIIGATFFILFYMSLFRRIFKTRRSLKWIFYSLLSWMAFILFIEITSWTYQFSVYFVCFGIIIGVTKTANLKNVSFF